MCKKPTRKRERLAIFSEGYFSMFVDD